LETTLVPAVLAVLASVHVDLADRDRPPTYSERSVLVAESRGLTALEVENSRGQVKLEASEDGRVHLSAVKACHMRDESEARRYAARTSVQAGPVGDRYVVRVHYPDRIESRLNFWDLFSERGRRNFNLPTIEVLLVVRVPAGMRARVSTVSGDVASEGLAGAQHLSTTSGDVEVHVASGPLEIETVSGDVVLERAAHARVRTTSGALTARESGALDGGTVSGDVEVEGARDSLNLYSTSGDLKVSGAPSGLRARSTSGELAIASASGNVQLETSSGDIRARLTSPLSAATLHSISGDIVAELVPGLNATLAMRSAGGAVECRMPVVLLDHDRNSLSARIGSGGTPIRVTSSSGNLTVTSGGR
jgi:hypothetical protein